MVEGAGHGPVGHGQLGASSPPTTATASQHVRALRSLTSAPWKRRVQGAAQGGASSTPTTVIGSQHTLSPQHRGGGAQEERGVALGLLKRAHPVLVRQVLCTGSKWTRMEVRSIDNRSSFYGHLLLAHPVPIKQALCPRSVETNESRLMGTRTGLLACGCTSTLATYRPLHCPTPPQRTRHASQCRCLAALEGRGSRWRVSNVRQAGHAAACRIQAGGLCAVRWRRCVCAHWNGAGEGHR